MTAPEPLFSARTTRWILLGWMAVLLVAVAVLSTRAVGESARQRDAIQRQLQIDCGFYGDIAQAPVAPQTVELGRRLVRDARSSWDRRGCEAVTGPLPPIDPDALKAAPPTRSR